MKTLYFLSFCILMIALSSCSSQRNAQTSDDTYYSQGRQTTSNASQSEYDYYSANTSDQYLMMRVQNPNRWSAFDDYDYGYAGAYSPYSYGSSWIYSGFGFSPWMSYGLYPYYGYGFGYMNYYAWNCFHNPYYGGPVVIGNSYSMYGAYNQLHPFNVTSYNNRIITNSNVRNRNFYTPASTTTRYSTNNNLYNRNTFNNNNNNNSNRRSYYNNQNNNNANSRQQNNFQQPTRSFTPSTGGGGNSGGGMRGSFGHH